MTPLAIAPAQADVKTRPILFSGPMVQALLEGKKTQTRRILKPQPPSQEAAKSTPYGLGPRVSRSIGFYSLNDYEHLPKEPGVFDVSGAVRFVRDHCGQTEWTCPYGVPGERLWVRETFTRGVLPVTAEGGSQLKRGPVVTEGRFADDWQHAAWYDGTDDPWGWFSERKRIPSIFMPRWASRLTLEITEVRVERLQAISEADAVAEGLSRLSKDDGRTFKYGLADRDGLPGEDNTGWHWDRWDVDPRKVYRTLWEGMHGAGSWEANPWVWAVSFKVVPQ